LGQRADTAPNYSNPLSFSERNLVWWLCVGLFGLLLVTTRSADVGGTDGLVVRQVGLAQRQIPHHPAGIGCPQPVVGEVERGGNAAEAGRRTTMVGLDDGQATPTV
jgi:hypothetical protein